MSHRPHKAEGITDRAVIHHNTPDKPSEESRPRPTRDIPAALIRVKVGKLGRKHSTSKEMGYGLQKKLGREHPKHSTSDPPEKNSHQNGFEVEQRCGDQQTQAAQQITQQNSDPQRAAPIPGKAASHNGAYARSHSCDTKHQAQADTASFPNRSLSHWMFWKERRS